MKKYIVLFIPIIAVLLLMILMRSDLNPDYRNYRIDKKTWGEMSTLFREDNISKVILYGTKNIELENNEKDDFIRKLSEAKFQKSNWKGEGPTPSVTITIIFEDGSYVNFGYWGTSLFETSYKQRQFIILSYDIANILDKYKVNI